MQVQTINNCNITDAAAEVNYNCIKGSMNMCSPVTTTVNGSVYLHSPGFPDSVGVTSRCVVRITGQTILVTLVEERMRGSGMLNISGDGRQLWTNENANQYNRVLPGQAAEIVIVYDNHDQDGSNVWIRVAGQMNITVTGEILDASTTPTSTQQPPRSQSTSGPSTSDTPTTETKPRAQSTTIASFTTVTSTSGQPTRSTGNITTQWTSKSTMVSTTVSRTDTSNSEDIVTALAVVCGILVLIIVVLVIYFMVVKPFRKKHDTSSNTGTSVEHGETNVYDGIQPNTSVAGDEHNYDRITSSEGPCYANSVSGNDPYVNT
ncbi:cell wall protein DAN4-like [Haliotis rubra]|uniref:cell wall protein DAN4-like n=1 Tax=Haliotis rubra TaxID=36100 RepID=UPI001EE5294C|nr:cell wall protein DAN4-like [Haliotis rubra]